jgi:hypothetical protein
LLLFAAAPDAWSAQTKPNFVVYERIKGLLYDGGEWSDDELRLLLARSAEANGWNEPAMDDYDQDANRAKPCR